MSVCWSGVEDKLQLFDESVSALTRAPEYTCRCADRSKFHYHWRKPVFDQETMEIQISEICHESSNFQFIDFP